MPDIRYTLLADGTSDRALIPHLTWLLQQHLPNHAIQSEMAELWRLPKPPKGLPERIQRALSLYPCDLLFVHRDAEREQRQARLEEINAALVELSQAEMPPVLGVVPVRMQEAWLIFDEVTIRHAANNRYGKIPLQLPPLSSIENRPNPKQDLHELLRTASGLGSRRLHKFSESRAAQRVSELTDDFSALRIVPAFAALEADINRIIVEQNWQLLPEPV